MRNTMLDQEYGLRQKMDAFEVRARSLVSKMQTYSLIEFYHEEDVLMNSVAKLKQGLDDFNTYLPTTQVIMKDKLRAEKDIMVDMRERLNGYIIKLNHSFALSNYNYV